MFLLPAFISDGGSIRPDGVVPEGHVAIFNGESFEVYDQSDAPQEPSPVPQQITMRQARLALLSIGRLNDVMPAILAMPEPERSKAQIEWEYSAAVKRSQPHVILIAQQLGLSALDLDHLFRAGADL
jgi:hypothetical protein